MHSSRNLCTNTIARSHPHTPNETLPSLLIRPIQLIPRYRLLMAELLRRELARRGLEAIANLARHINEGLRESERFQNLSLLQIHHLDKLIS
mmetsp:Transcript_25485/g.41036  ORF Transcript_25485/g.41036 Transcript_25485/m.41036 type:complete len:92 (+) Transcript_25485:903-1178(+)